MDIDTHRVVPIKGGKLIISICSVCILLVFTSMIAFAEPDAVEQVEIFNGTPETRDSPGAGSIAAQGGNITEFNMTVTSQTGYWQGFWGNIEFTMSLRDANNNSFYNWTAANVSAGEVFFSNNSAITWDSNWLNGTDANVAFAQINDGWANNTNPDNLTQTYTIGHGHQQFNITLQDEVNREINASTTPSVNLQGGLFNNTMLWNTPLDLPLWVALINPDAAGFNGQSIDFQVLLPVRDYDGIETYYAYVELE